MTDPEVQIAASLSGAVLMIPAVLVVALLIGAFIWGSRRQARTRRPAYRSGAARGPRSGSHASPEERATDRRGADGHSGRTPPD
ncbi:DUF6479 family protein [Kitasatospora purpeofusca]|uniref:DUF6479 family protein n=1 Tax=Kitasatospora purpeofusca TaxID=67352 RepID=UPI0036CB6DA9